MKSYLVTATLFLLFLFFGISFLLFPSATQTRDGRERVVLPDGRDVLVDFDKVVDEVPECHLHPVTVEGNPTMLAALLDARVQLLDARKQPFSLPVVKEVDRLKETLLTKSHIRLLALQLLVQPLLLKKEFRALLLCLEFLQHLHTEE